jgi:hypothetical protein
VVSILCSSSRAACNCWMVSSAAFNVVMEVS